MMIIKGKGYIILITARTTIGIKKKKDINRTKNGIVEFFPADKKELLNKLVYLLGEYHSGNNKSLRNEIVPIVSYLRSHNALPYKFDKRRMNWIYD